MVFERPVSEPVINWNISGDTFIFQECGRESSVYVVKLESNVTPAVFEFKLPPEIKLGKHGRKYDPNRDRIIAVDKDKDVNEIEFLEDDSQAFVDDAVEEAFQTVKR